MRSRALDPLPLSQTVAPSRTPSPSSVTYFMEGPMPFKSTFYALKLYKCNCFYHLITKE